MAAPGSGPSRRSHTKSRRGCKTCKRRHVRCDESFPQCNNCTKHQVRCDYQDSTPATDTPANSSTPGLGWSSDIEVILDQWQRSGVCKLGNFTVDLRRHGQAYTKNELFLIYHCLNCGNAVEGNEFTVWALKIPRFLDLAASYPFLMQAILAFGALSVAWEKKSPDAKNLTAYYSAEAMKGLQNAIGSFSRENSDAVLATSILLSWQANDWKSWSSLVSGIRTVVNRMQPWKSQSPFADIMSEQEFSIPQSFPSHSHLPSTEESRRQYSAVLQHIHRSLSILQPYLFGRDMESQFVEQLRDYIERLLGVRQAQSPEEQFNHLYALRKWLFWIPAYLLKASQRHFITLTMISYFYATALALEPLYPSVAPAFCAGPAVRSLEEILKEIDKLEGASSPPNFSDINAHLLSFPRTALSSYRTRQLELDLTDFAGRLSPIDFENNSGLAWAMEAYMPTGQRSPSFPMSGLSRSSAEASSPGSSSYMDVPQASIGEGIAQAPYVLPSMSPTGELEDPYGYNQIFQGYSSGGNQPGPPDRPQVQSPHQGGRRGR